ncbi:MAG: hypothetical protein M1357_02865, partial [Candidatus Marsarchaeota archaeon]|nr:hypothetical protein [Candidatus Marsarchaeota archaeon]
MVAAGLALTVIGCAVLAGMAYYSLSTLRSDTLHESPTQMVAGEWVSTEISFPRIGDLTVKVNPNGSGSISGYGYLVSSANLSKVSYASATSFGVPPYERTNYVFSYANLTGDYYFIVFSNTTPELTLVYYPLSQQS